MAKAVGIQAAVLGQAIFSSRAELLQGPAGLGYADHGDIQVAAQNHLLQGRENLLISEVACGAEEDQCVREHCVLRGAADGRGIFG